jgi:hypothetical protein
MQQLGRLLTMITAAWLLVFWPDVTYAAQPTPVEVWRVGDDGLTMKFSDAVETEFKASPAFVLSSGKKPGTLIVTIPTNVAWKRIGKRTQIRYAIEFKSINEKKLGSNAGICWENSLQNCAAQVVRAAVSAANRLGAVAGSSDTQR